ncbi:MAG: DUF2244 domain-containing protein [Burkholderiaceae bacterium]
MTGKTEAFRLAQRRDDAWHWSLRRSCAMSPSQLASVFVMLGAASLAVAGFFWSQGAVLVMPFALLEWLALGVAFVVHARHATDGESVILRGASLVVESEKAGVVRRCEFERVRVRLNGGGPVLIEVRAGSRTVSVGRHLRPDLRPVFLRELQQALTQA